MKDNEIGFGVAPARFDIRDYKIKYKGIATASTFPNEFNLPLLKVKHQGPVGSCVAHSISTIIEYFNKIETNKNIIMSTGYIYGNRRNSNWKKPGMRIRDALKNVYEYGDVPNNYMPNNLEVPKAIEKFEEQASEIIEIGKVNKIKKFYKITSESAMKQCLMNYGPILVVIKWYSNSFVDDNGILNIDNNKKYYQGQHCMVCYGWNDKGWKIQNSWGISWGKSGKCIIPFKTKFTEVWGLIDQENIQTETLELIQPCKSKVSNTAAKGLNTIINFIIGRE